jgi:adenylate cyclase class 2
VRLSDLEKGPYTAGVKRGETREVETKLRVADAAAMRQRLQELGAGYVGRVFERNTLFDTPRGALAKSGHLVRLRETQNTRTGKRGYLLTWKGPAGRGGRYKIREERNARLANARAGARALDGLGLEPSFVYEKYRTTYRLPGLGRLLVELDETPIGAFLELEGPRKEIDRAARRLGYRRGDYVARSYRALFLEYRRKHPSASAHMVFSRRKKGT